MGAVVPCTGYCRYPKARGKDFWRDAIRYVQAVDAKKFLREIWSSLTLIAMVVQPRNYILLACHMANESVQSYNLYRWADYNYSLSGMNPKTDKGVTAPI
eukprot:671401-Pyramimonas_sp.AAC.2